MKKVQQLHTFEQIKLLADPRRLEILRLLMDKPATLTQLAKNMGQSPAWVRHHVQKLEVGRLVELAEVRTTGKVTEKFYRANASALFLQEVILPITDQPVVIFSGSNDLALETVADSLSEHVALLSIPVGSLNGLVNLRQGLCQLSGAHLLDESGEYNLPFVRHIFPDQDVEIVTLAHRTQGLIVAPGNPKDIRYASDLTQTGLRFINRNPGSGTRLWLDMELNKLGILPDQISGYDQVVNTHREAAFRVASGTADVTLGLQAAANQHALGFIPLFEERYDLVLPRENEGTLAPVLEYIQTADFRKTASGLTGYRTAHSGEHISR